MRNIRKLLTEERGNTALFVMGLLGIMMILFVFVINLAQILAVKEKASSTVQQASLAATSAFYETLWPAIKDYKYIPLIEDEIPLDIPTIEEKVSDKIYALKNSGSFNDYSDNEIRIEAIDSVVVEELNSISGYDFRPLVQQVLPSAFQEMKAVAINTIEKNHGNITEAKLIIVNSQIYVKASNDVEGTSYGNFFGISEKLKLFQQSGGPEIFILNEFSNYSNFEITLEQGNIGGV